MQRPDEEGGSVLSTTLEALSVFNDAKIARNTSNSEFYMDMFQETTVPISLYLTIPYSDVDRISPIIRMFVTLFSRRFTAGETQATNRKFKVPILFILDEFDKLGRMDELEKNMGIHLGYGIQYFLIFQSLVQLNKLYTKDNAFQEHCRNTIFYAPAGFDNADMISKTCGRESVNRANLSYSGGRGGVTFNNKSLSDQDTERNLINADEVLKLPYDQEILLTQDMPPAIVKKNVYYEDQLFKSRYMEKNPKTGKLETRKPAFTTREEALKAAAGAIEHIKTQMWFYQKPETEAAPKDTGSTKVEQSEKLDETQTAQSEAAEPERDTEDDGPQPSDEDGVQFDNDEIIGYVNKSEENVETGLDADAL
jgi:type IV secretion system protein VirD4